MTTLLILSSAILTLLILIQNPKGINNRVTATVGVKTSKSVLSKSTWIFGIGVALLSLGMA